MWLAAQKNKGMASAVFGQKDAVALFKFAEHAQQLGADSLMGQRGIDAVATAFSLQRASAQVNVNNDNVAKWIVKKGPSSLVFIALRGHAVAARVTSKEKKDVLFFEPNDGVFSFPDTLKFVLFFQEYLAHTNQTAQFLKFYR